MLITAARDAGRASIWRADTEHPDLRRERQVQRARVRPDADEADAVLRRRGHRRGGRAVKSPTPADRRCRVRADDLRMRDVGWEVDEHDQRALRVTAGATAPAVAARSRQPAWGTTESGSAGACAGAPAMSGSAYASRPRARSAAASARARPRATTYAPSTTRRAPWARATAAARRPPRTPTSQVPGSPAEAALAARAGSRAEARRPGPRRRRAARGRGREHHGPRGRRGAERRRGRRASRRRQQRQHQARCRQRAAPGDLRQVEIHATHASVRSMSRTRIGPT